MDKYNKFYEEYSKIERKDLKGSLIFSKEKYDQIVAFFLGNSEGIKSKSKNNWF